jgi:hypothetical protein
MMTNEDTIWLAGLLEGEGTFDLHRDRYPRVRVAMTDRDVVGRAATLFGSSIRLSLKRLPYKATWHAEITGAKAVAIMRAVLPHMGSRRSGKIAEILGAFYMRGGEKTSLPGPAMTRPPGLDKPIRAAVHT